MRRNAGTIRTLFDEPALGAGSSSCARISTPGSPPARCPPHDTGLMAAAMVGAAVEVGLEMVARETIDADASAAFVTSVFVGAFVHMR